jgi:hypothetical protein
MATMPQSKNRTVSQIKKTQPPLVYIKYISLRKANTAVEWKGGKITSKHMDT